MRPEYITVRKPDQFVGNGSTIISGYGSLEMSCGRNVLRVGQGERITPPQGERITPIGKAPL